MKKKSISIERLVKEAGKETISIEELLKYQKKEKWYKKRWIKPTGVGVIALISALGISYLIEKYTKPNYRLASEPTKVSIKREEVGLGSDNKAIKDIYDTIPYEYECELSEVDKQIKSFENFIIRFPKSEYVPEALMNIAYLHVYSVQCDISRGKKLEHIKKAKECYERMFTEYKSETWSKSAKEVYDALSMNEKELSKEDIDAKSYFEVYQLYKKLFEQIPLHTKTPSKPVKEETTQQQSQNWPTFRGKLDFTYQESLPLEDRVLFDVFVKGNSSNFTSPSLDSSLMQCVKNALNPSRNFKAVFDINDNGDVVYCDFVANNVKEKTNTLSKEDYMLYVVDGVIKEKRESIREGNYDLNLIIKGKNVVIPIDFSMKKEYEYYTFVGGKPQIAAIHLDFDNSMTEMHIKSFFSRYYQGDVAIDNEYAYIIHNDLDGPTLVKVSLKPYLEEGYHQGMDVSEHIWKKKSIDKELIIGNYKPGGRIVNIEVDDNLIYASFLIRSVEEDELPYTDAWHSLRFMGAYNKDTLELTRKKGGLSRDTSLGFSYVSDIKADNKGHFYIVDSNNSKIQVFNSDCTLNISFGEKGALEGKFNRPTKIAFDNSGNIYVLDPGNKRIEKFRVN